MFGSYSVCNIIVLLNMLIAMMSNSYQVCRDELFIVIVHQIHFSHFQIIMERSDVEWKFSRSKVEQSASITFILCH